MASPTIKKPDLRPYIIGVGAISLIVFVMSLYLFISADTSESAGWPWWIYGIGVLLLGVGIGLSILKKDWKAGSTPATTGMVMLIILLLANATGLTTRWTADGGVFHPDRIQPRVQPVVHTVPVRNIVQDFVAPVGEWNTIPIGRQAICPDHNRDQTYEYREIGFGTSNFSVEIRSLTGRPVNASMAISPNVEAVRRYPGCS